MLNISHRLSRAYDGSTRYSQMVNIWILRVTNTDTRSVTLRAGLSGDDVLLPSCSSSPAGSFKSCCKYEGFLSFFPGKYSMSSHKDQLGVAGRQECFKGENQGSIWTLRHPGWKLRTFWFYSLRSFPSVQQDSVLCWNSLQSCMFYEILFCNENLGGGRSYWTLFLLVWKIRGRIMRLLWHSLL